MEPKEKKAFEPSGLVPRSIVRTFERFRQQLLPGSETAAIREYRISRYQVLVSVRCLFTLLIIPIATNWFVSSWLLSPLVEHFWNTQQNEIFLNSYQEERAFAELESFSEKLFFESLLNTNTINVDLRRNNEIIVLTDPLQVASPHVPLPYQSSYKYKSEICKKICTEYACGELRLGDLSADLYGSYARPKGVRVNDFTPSSSSKSSVTTSLIPLQRSATQAQRAGVAELVLSQGDTSTNRRFVMRGRGNANTAINNNNESNAVETLFGKAFDAALLPAMTRENPDPFASTIHNSIGVKIQYLPLQGLLQPSYCAYPIQIEDLSRGCAKQSPLQVQIGDLSENLSEDLSGSYCADPFRGMQSPKGVHVESYNDKSPTLHYRHIPLQRILAFSQRGMHGIGNAGTATISSNWESKATDFSASDLSAHTLDSFLSFQRIPLWGNASTGIAQLRKPFGVCPHLSFPYKSSDKSPSLNPLQVQIGDLSEDLNTPSLLGTTLSRSSTRRGAGSAAYPMLRKGVMEGSVWGNEQLTPSGVCCCVSEMCGLPRASQRGTVTCKGLKASSVLSVPLESTDDNSVKIKEKVQNKILELAIYYNQQTIISITNIVGDVVSLVTLGCLFIWMKPEITILKSFLIEAIYSLSDTTKSFLLILLTDLLVGFHSPRGWETALELLLKHFGLPENQDFVFLFVATFPVLLDTVFKYWIFRHLNKISPSTVATYHSMIE